MFIIVTAAGGDRKELSLVNVAKAPLRKIRIVHKN